MANTNSQSKLYVCAASQANDLDQAGFEALTYVLVGNVGEVGETGSDTNILTYDTWDTKVAQKAKGIIDAGSPDVEVARDYDDAGQNILRAAAKTNLNYAFKIVKNDAIIIGGTGTTIYNRGLVTGPKRPNGRNEDFDLEQFTFALQQEEIVVDPTSGGVAPYVTVLPAITGTAEVGEVLTCSNGTWSGDATITYTHAWFANSILLPGETGSTLTLTSAHLGKIIQGRVGASNAAGSASALSNLTAAVAA